MLCSWLNVLLISILNMWISMNVMKFYVMMKWMVCVVCWLLMVFISGDSIVFRCGDIVSFISIMLMLNMKIIVR